jgi:hypothetical protein
MTPNRPLIKSTENAMAKPIEKPAVSVIVSNHNGLKYGLLEPCLTSVFNMEYPNFEVLVVDNASNDGSVEYIKRMFGFDRRLRIIKNSVNSYSLGLNLAVQAALGEYLLFLNNDIKIDRNYIEEMLKVLEKNPDVGLAQGKLLAYANPHIIDSVGETMDILGTPVTVGAGEVDNGQYNKVLEILSASGSASITRRNVIEEVGGFDPQYGIGYEDMDFGLRVRLRGYRVLFVPNAIVYHKRAATDLKEEIRLNVKFHFNKNRVATLIKNYEIKNLIRVIPVVFFYYCVAFFYESLIERDVPKAMKRFTSLGWNLKKAKYLLRQRKIVQRKLRRVRDKEIFEFMADKQPWLRILAWRRSNKF